jgi:hypothetical protein
MLKNQMSLVVKHLLIVFSYTVHGVRFATVTDYFTTVAIGFYLG